MKRFAISVILGLGLLAFITAHPALAQDGDDPISSGLQSGANFFLPDDSPQNTPHTPQKVATYAALGDSVAAGLGLSDTPSQCGRSTQSYPYAVAAQLDLPLIHVACSGATAGDLFTYQGVTGPNIAPQLDTAFASGIPQVMSITAGANDAHWSGFIKACYATNCDTQASTIAANAYLSILQFKLYYLFSNISSRSGNTPPTVIMTGYYNPLSSQCSLPQITPSELNWISAETSALNQTIQNVSAQYSFVKFAPVDFTGHDICSSNSWVQGINDAAPFHPTAQGQRVIANVVLQTLGW